jgi:hypothetical protein
MHHSTGRPCGERVFSADSKGYEPTTSQPPLQALRDADIMRICQLDWRPQVPIDLIKPHVRDLGAFSVKRLLPAAQHRAIGPFVFFDHFGPVLMPVGQGMDVRPHPHIGLATVTYLFEGSGLHRDSLGTVQEIRPGDVNWMVAGRGIVHSERTPEADLNHERVLHGLQVWVGLPPEEETREPSFSHHPGHTLPLVKMNGVALRVIIGSVLGVQAPTPTFSPTFYVHAQIDPNSEFLLELGHEERGVYAVNAPIEIDGTIVPEGTMAYLPKEDPIRVRSSSEVHAMFFGGSAIKSELYLNWNFVASNHGLIEKARQSWTTYPNAQFGQVPDETEWIPLPPH